MIITSADYISTISGARISPKFAVINVGGLGDNTLVAAVAGKKIRVLSLVIVASSAVVVRFESGGNGTALTGRMALSDATILALQFNPHGHFETAPGELLNLELGALVDVDGFLTYLEI